MKKISRSQLKTINGGNHQQGGCYVTCCAYQNSDGSCRDGWQGTSTITTCSDPVALQYACFGGVVVGCYCFNGPHMP